jgi:hypothetical protein
MDPDFLHEEETHFVFAHADQMLEEIGEIASICSFQFDMRGAHGSDLSLRREKVWEAVELMLSILGKAERPSPSEINAALSKLSVPLMQQLFLASNKASAQIRYLRTLARGKDFSPTSAFLVSPLWSRRIDRTLGGQLFPAYIGSWIFLNE